MIIFNDFDKYDELRDIQGTSAKIRLNSCSVKLCFGDSFLKNMDKIFSYLINQTKLHFKYEAVILI